MVAVDHCMVSFVIFKTTVVIVQGFVGYLLLYFLSNFPK